MKVKHYFIIVGLSIIAFIALMNYKPTTAVSTSSPTETGSKIQYGVKQYIIINKIAPVEVQIFDGVNAAYILVSQVDADTPYFYHYNKGLPHENRGIVPAYKDWEVLGFVPSTNKLGLVKVELSLPKDAPMKSSELSYIIKKM